MKLKYSKHIISVVFVLTVVIMTGVVFTGQSSCAEPKDDIEAVNQVIEDFQNAYTAKKIVDVQNQFHYLAVVGIDFNSNTSQEIMTLKDWLDATREVFKEQPWLSDKLTNRQINVYENSMATVVCDYDYKDKGHHQVGVDVFTLMKIRGQWKIISLIFSGDVV